MDFFKICQKFKKIFISMKAYPLSWPRESNENFPKSQSSEIKQAVHFNEGIDCSAEHSYQVWTKSVVWWTVETRRRIVDEKGYK